MRTPARTRPSGARVVLKPVPREALAASSSTVCRLTTAPVPACAGYSDRESVPVGATGLKIVPPGMPGTGMMGIDVGRMVVVPGAEAAVPVRRHRSSFAA